MLKAILLALFSVVAFAADDHATISLQRHKNLIVVTVDHDKGWHTYWKNPGDSGLPSSFKFTHKGKPLALAAHEWPVPTKHLEAGDILTIGYEGRQHFFFAAEKGDIEAHITVLICADICIPGEAKLTLPAGQTFTSNRPAKEFGSDELNMAFENLPKPITKPEGLEFYLTRVKGQNNLTLHYSLKGVSSAKLPHELNFLTPFPHAPFGFKRESLYFQDKTVYGKTEIEWDGEYQEPVVPLPESGQFTNAYQLEFLINNPLSGKVEKVILPVKDFSHAAPTLDEFYKKLPPFDGKGSHAAGGKVTSASPDKMNFFQYLLFAFLGGLILNLMPCVLPVISIKLFGLIKHRETTRKQLLSHNLSYTSGVIATFMVLGGVVAAIKATGEQIGWGFQLQSPTFIFVMLIVLFIMSLNMFGLFEFATPGGSKLGGAQTEDSFLGDFFSGVLTTILSTPCSAPFLGTALTFAFTTNVSTIFIMFFAIGLGLASPFLLTALFPQSLKFFPRPGAWMEKLKYFLGLSLLATIVWLYDVFASLVDYEHISWRLNLVIALWFFAFFFARKISQQKVLQFAFFAVPLTLSVLLLQNLRPPRAMASNAQDNLWIPWTEEKMLAVKEQPVFVDFTAEWCLTCKVNKKLVMETDGFEELRRKYNFITMRADWTKRDDNITTFLKAHNAVGVPAYFIQKPGGQLLELGETISLGKIEENLR